MDVLTALDGVWCHLQRHRSPRGLVDVNPEHHPHTRVLASDVGLPLPQLYVRVTQLQDSRAVDSVFAKTQDKESAGSVYDIYNLTLNQDLCSKDFHSGLHHCSPEEGCQQKINIPTPSRAFTPQWTCSGVKLKLYRKKAWKHSIFHESVWFTWAGSLNIVAPAQISPPGIGYKMYFEESKSSSDT